MIAIGIIVLIRRAIAAHFFLRGVHHEAAMLQHEHVSARQFVDERNSASNCRDRFTIITTSYFISNTNNIIYYLVYYTIYYNTV